MLLPKYVDAKLLFVVIHFLNFTFCLNNFNLSYIQIFRVRTFSGIISRCNMYKTCINTVKLGYNKWICGYSEQMTTSHFIYLNLYTNFLVYNEHASRI
jgi:hypothetical protein